MAEQHLPSRGRIVAFATKGTGSNEEGRIVRLLSEMGAELLPYDKRSKLRSFARLARLLPRRANDLVVMEGTGIAGGAACLLARLLAGVPYVVSSGDAVGPFVAGRSRLAGPLFAIYERLLCRLSAGFIGWSPYLVGRALTFGAPRGMTAAGWAADLPDAERLSASRRRVRERLGIAADALVFGLVGSLDWNMRYGYCYGRELVEAATAVRRTDLVVLVVGGGPGLERLQALAGAEVGSRVLLPGPVPAEQVMDYLAAMDVASLPQSVDGVGSFRYTTKLSEYLAARLPVVTGEIPLAYDLGGNWLWRLPGDAPWDPLYGRALARLMQTLDADELAARRASVPAALPEFDPVLQVARTTAFISDILEQRARRRTAASDPARPSAYPLGASAPAA